MLQNCVLVLFLFSFLCFVPIFGQECPNSNVCGKHCEFHGRCLSNGTCYCKTGWTGHDCAQKTCADCVHGDCSLNGSCTCTTGWMGQNCDQFIGLKPFTKPICSLDGICICNETTFANCTEKVGPDFVPFTQNTRPFIEYKVFNKCSCPVDEGCAKAGRRKLLKFSIETLNKGTADLFIGSPASYLDKYIWHSCHHHPHLVHWTEFILRHLATNETHIGWKSGSAVIDSRREKSVIGGSTYRKYSDKKQGLQVGWVDWYPYYLDCQWIDVTDLPLGDYHLEITSNPAKAVYEIDYTNNLEVVPITCNQTCVNGLCDFGHSCVCQSGWTGAACDTPDTSGHVCTPVCNRRSCGSNGCAGSCGECSYGEHCEDGACACSPQCIGRFCGDDGCGGSCGECISDDETCASDGTCYICRSDLHCANKMCGPDGCGGSCGRCHKGLTCDEQGQCVCLPKCHQKICGDDGCGGVCGSCEDNMACNNITGTCQCTPNCTGKICGSDGCGGNCGECVGNNMECTENGLCDCIPNCLMKDCGDDGCGGECGKCEFLERGFCTEQGSCVCLSNCTGKQCGADECGMSCGLCDYNEVCTNDGQCICHKQCAENECGDDGCGGNCGNCDEDELCMNGMCLCVPSCEDKECGTDGCNGTCGSCNTHSICTQDHKCVCLADCQNKACGDNGCGGSCGRCHGSNTCIDGVCDCLPQCEGKECGDNGCSGECGVCDLSLTCKDNKCVCTPNCTNKECGSDGCGGTCGTGCRSDEICNAFSGVCECSPNCTSKICGSDGCGGSCGSCAESNNHCTDTGLCICIPQCQNKQCGDDSCGGSCGSCNINSGKPSYICLNNQCSCVPDCEGKVCGSDGCGGSCGSCDNTQDSCTDTGKCVCVKQCHNGKQCGDDGCGGHCGVCSDNSQCSLQGFCSPCVPTCLFNNFLRSCGSDGCGGNCGVCSSNNKCLNEWKCIDETVGVNKIDMKMTFHLFDDNSKRQDPLSSEKINWKNRMSGLLSIPVGSLVVDSYEVQSQTVFVYFSLFDSEAGSAEKVSVQFQAMIKAADPKLKEHGFFNSNANLISLVDSKDSSDSYSNLSSDDLHLQEIVVLAGFVVIGFTLVAIFVVVIVWIKRSRQRRYSTFGTVPDGYYDNDDDGGL